MRTAFFGLLLTLASFLPGCDLAYPEVAVVNRIGPDVVMRDPSFNGCRWDAILNFGDTTTPRRCLPGEGKVHFRKFDVAAYDDPPPMWFAYQTVRTWSLDEGDFRVIEIVADDLEQDFSVPGPYGH